MAEIRWWKVAPVLLALGATSPGADPQYARPDDGATAEVQPGKLAVTVVERGVLEPSRSKDVLCQVEGTTTIIQILPEGRAVKKGDVVGELDSSGLRDRIVNQRIAIQQAEANYKDARTAREVAEYAVKEYVVGLYPQQLEGLKGRITVAQDSIRAAEARLERTRRARKRLDESLTRKKESERTPSDIVADLTIDDRLEVAELDLSRHKLDLALATSERDLIENLTKEKTIKQLMIDVERKRAEEFARQSAWDLAKGLAAKLEKQVESCTLVAPIDGLVVHANDQSRGGPPQIEEGATVRERQIIFKVIDVTAPMRVNLKVREAVVDRVRSGLRARIAVDAYPGQELAGEVQAVAPLPDPMSRFANGVKVYTTRLKIDRGPAGLRPGMTAQAEVLVTELDNVLAVPIGSVTRFDDKDHVAVKKPGGGVEWREVTLGLSNDKVVEVRRGLQAGDLVFLNPVAQMTDEMKREVFGRATRLR